MISAAKFIVKDDKLLLVKLRRDITSITLLDTKEIRAIRLETLAAILLYEFVFLVKFCTFFPEKGIEEIWSSDSTIFVKQILEKSRNMMNLIILVITIQSKDHWNKNVVNSGGEMWIKGIDKLPNWLVKIVAGYT